MILALQRVRTIGKRSKLYRCFPIYQLCIGHEECTRDMSKKPRRAGIGVEGGGDESGLV
jgi:hypothetical protein